MKKLFSLTLVLSAIIFLSMSGFRPGKNHAPKTIYNLAVTNGTSWRGTITAYGASYIPYPDTFGTSGYYYIGPVNTGVATYITVNIVSFAPGSRTYTLTGVSGASPQTNSAGHASWTGLTVTGNVTASIN